jgi:hypothetical protein
LTVQAVFTNRDLFDIKFMSRSAISRDTWRSARQQLAPALPMKLSDPSLYSAPLKAHSAAPLTALAQTDEALQVGKEARKAQQQAGPFMHVQQYWRCGLLLLVLPLCTPS